MKVTNIIKALFLPLILTFLALGCILMFIGGVQWLQLDPRTIQRDGLSRPLDFFADCGMKAQQELPALRQRIAENRTGTSGGGGGGEGGGEGKSSGADIGTMLAERCNTQQRPYKWLMYFTAAEVGLTFLLLCWMIYKAPTGLLSWLAIQTAIVTALMVVAIYATMQLQAQTKNLVDCQGYDDTARAEVQNLGLQCYQGGNKPTSLKNFDHWSVIWWVGTGFAIGGLGLLTFLVPLMHWAKIRLAHQGYGDPEDGYGRDEYNRDARSREYGGAAGSGSGGRTAYDRDTHARNIGDRYSANERDTDRWGSGRAGTAGAAGAGAGAARYRHEEEPSFLSKMTGGYFNTDRDREREHRYGGPQAPSSSQTSSSLSSLSSSSATGAGGTSRGREYDRSQHERERGGYGGRDYQHGGDESFISKMTGGYFGSDRDRAQHERERERGGVGGIGTSGAPSSGGYSGYGGYGYGGGREREREYGYQRDQREEPSFLSRMTGGYLGTSDRDKELERERENRERYGNRGGGGAVEMQSSSLHHHGTPQREQTTMEKIQGGIDRFTGREQGTQQQQHGVGAPGGATGTSQQSSGGGSVYPQVVTGSSSIQSSAPSSSYHSSPPSGSSSV